MRVEKTLIQTLACQLSSTLMQLLFSFDQDRRVEKTLIQTLACQLSSTLMQLLFSFDQDRRVEKTLIQTLACQLSSTLMQLLFSFDQDMRALRNLFSSNPAYNLAKNQLNISKFRRITTNPFVKNELFLLLFAYFALKGRLIYLGFTK